mgnify:CR=1 FL=1
MHAKLPVALIAYITHDERGVLLIHRQGTDKWDGMWGFPGGRLDVSESITEWIIREVREEVGIEVERDWLTAPLIVNHHDKGGERIYAIFRIDQFQGEPYNAEPEYCRAVQWFPLSALPSPLTPQVEIVLAALREGKSYWEWGFDE